MFAFVAVSVEKSSVGSVCEACAVLLRLLVGERGGRLGVVGAAALCEGRGRLEAVDRLQLAAALKVARLPTRAAPAVPDAEPLKRPRSDLSAAILEQLTTPLAPDGPAPDADPRALFVRANAHALKALDAGDKILDLCLDLAHLKPYLAR